MSFGWEDSGEKMQSFGWEDSGGGGGDDLTINVEELASSLHSRLSSNKLVRSPKGCIFRAPEMLRRHNEEAYVPAGFSFGPFHHDNPTLKKTENIKLMYLQDLISRAQNPRKCLSDLLHAIGKMEKEARACYAEQVDYTAGELVEMLVVDGCFLIEFFRRCCSLSVCADHLDDPVLSIASMREFLHKDLILLENQVPWQVLMCLFNMTNDNGSHDLITILVKYFTAMFSCTAATIEQSLVNQEHKHILDLLRNWLISPLRLVIPDFTWEPFLSATNMEEAGIKFRKRDSRSILDIQFSNGVLEIPSLKIEEPTEIVLRNLISYEQCVPNCRPIVTSYSILLDSLINNKKDLDILSKNEIVRCWLNPEDAVQMFSKLYIDACVSEFFYSAIVEQVNAYCKRRWPRWRAAYVRNYFTTPWAIASQLLAAILLILTFLQTLYTMKG